MRISTYSDYALRVLMHAALRRPERSTVDEVANAFSISRHHLVKIVHDLGRHGYLATQRGIGGGFTLALPPEKIGIGDVVRLGEESETVIDCKDRRNRFCQIFPACRLKVVLDEAAASFFAVLDSYTLEDLLGQQSALKDLLQISTR
jgi:Rrf2 family transcriptional regulator, nitric oxide-sensitive transcriptional repressor